jgi:metal-responsive CopG/Arc/MetJ family transcriptional regulator
MNKKPTTRVPVIVSASELKAIEEWRRQKQLPSRSEALRQLIALGLRNASNQHQHRPSG